MRAPASILLLCLCLTTACAAPPKPAVVAPKPAPVAVASRPRGALTARAPATTRVLFRLAPAGSTMIVDLANQRETLALVALCGLDPLHDLVSMEGWITESGDVHAEITGTLTAKKLECVASALDVAITGKSTPLPLGPFHVTERPGGLVLSTGDAASGSGAPEALARRFDDLAAEGADMVIATSAGTPPFEATMRLQNAHATYELRIGRKQAAEAAAVLGPLLVGGHDPLLEGVTVAASGDRLVLGVKPSARVAFALRREVVEAFNMPAQSMSPALRLGDRFFVVKDVPARAPARGDVVVFEHKPGMSFVKRVIGLPGDHLVIEGDALTINGAPIVGVPVGEVVLDGQPDGKPPVRGAGFRETLGEHTYTVLREGEYVGDPLDLIIPADHVFVIGDNRHNSFDSRQFGPVPFAKLLGRAAVIYWSAGEKGIRWERLLQPVE